MDDGTLRVKCSLGMMRFYLLISNNIIACGFPPCLVFFLPSIPESQHSTVSST